jgi:hypothetical protein
VGPLKGGSSFTSLLPVRYLSDMSGFRWTPERMEQLEHAVQKRRRVSLRRRGNEYVVVASALTTTRGREALAGYLAMTGEELLFRLDDIDHFEVLDS